MRSFRPRSRSGASSQPVILRHEEPLTFSEGGGGAERSLRSPFPPSVVWLRIGNCSNRALSAWFRPLWPEIKRRLTAGDRVVEVR